jgi:hypothetical protein
MDSPEAYPAWNNAGGGTRTGKDRRQAGNYDSSGANFRLARHPLAIGVKLQTELPTSGKEGPLAVNPHFSSHLICLFD